MCVRREPCVALGDLAEGRRARVRTRAPGGDPLGPRGALGAGPRPVAPRAGPRGPRCRPDRAHGARGARWSGTDALAEVRRGLHERLLGRVDARTLEGVPRAERRLRVREEAAAVLRGEGHIMPPRAL